MTRRSDSYVHEWLSLVEMAGLVVSEPVLHTAFPAGPEEVETRAARGLEGAWERFLVDPADSARRRAWTEAVLFDLLGWPRQRFLGPREVPETAHVRPEGQEQPLDGVPYLEARGRR